MADEVPNLRGGHSATLAFILGPLLGASVIVGGFIWAAAKYPDRTEFNELRNTVIRMQLDQVVTKTNSEGQSRRLDAIEVKLDQLLSRKPGRER